MINKIKAWAKSLKRQIFILYFACKDERMPLYAKVYTACVVADAFSPIDLIPDFIPILGYLDDVILIPLAILLALKMIPKNVLCDSEALADQRLKDSKPKNWIVGSMIIMIWIALAAWGGMKLYLFFN